MSSLVAKTALMALGDLILHLHSLMGGSGEAFHCNEAVVNNLPDLNIVFQQMKKG